MSARGRGTREAAGPAPAGAAVAAREGPDRGIAAAPAGSNPDSPLSGAQLLQVWLSPSFPVGAFAYSHGLERAAEQRLVHDRPSLAAWIGDLVRIGSLRNDLVLLAAAWRAAGAGDGATLAEVAGLAAALHPSAERHLEAVQQGGSFLDQIVASWPAPALGGLIAAARGTHPDGATPVTYPVAVGVGAAAHDIALGETLAAYGLAFAGNLVSAAIRLSVVGQTDGQRTLATLAGDIAEAARRAERSTLEDLGSATLVADLASLQHETQYTRLFRS